MFKAFLAFCGLVTITTASVIDCNPTSYFHIEKLEFYPDPPSPNMNTTLYTEFYNPGLAVLDGTATTSVTYNYIPFAPSSEPLCNSQSCPIMNGLTTQTSTSPWPELSGLVDMKIEWLGTDGTSLLCIQIKTSTVIDNRSLAIVRDNYYSRLSRPQSRTQHSEYRPNHINTSNALVNNYKVTTTTLNSTECNNCLVLVSSVKFGNKNLTMVIPTRGSKMLRGGQTPSAFQKNADSF
jgi:hypothetical protein